MIQRGFMVFCRVSVPDSDGWYHIMPMGEFEAVATGPDGKPKRVTEVIDDLALTRIMADFTAKSADPEWQGYLVGKEHFSQDPDNTSEAYAWAKEIQVRNSADTEERERGIWARLEKTPLGEPVIGTVYKFFSAVNNMEHIAGKRYRPIDIDDIGLTNKPFFKTLVPAMHRDRNQEEGSHMLTKLMTLLAKHKVTLADGADEDAALEAVGTAFHRATETSTQITTVTARAETAEARVLELETADLGRQADEFVAKHKAKVTDEAKLRELYMTHREAAEGMIGLLKEPTGPQPRTLHRGDGKQPEGSPTADDAAKAAARQRERQEYVDQVKVQHRLPSNAIAWQMAQTLKPELFAEEGHQEEK